MNSMYSQKDKILIVKNEYKFCFHKELKNNIECNIVVTFFLLWTKLVYTFFQQERKLFSSSNISRIYHLIRIKVILNSSILNIVRRIFDVLNLKFQYNFL